MPDPSRTSFPKLIPVASPPPSVAVAGRNWRVAVLPGRLVMDPGQNVGPAPVRGYLDADAGRIVLAGDQSPVLRADAYWALVYFLRQTKRRWRWLAFPRTPMCDLPHERRTRGSYPQFRVASNASGLTYPIELCLPTRL